MSENKKDRRPEEKTIGEFVAEDYRTAEIFARHGIDFCCGGEVPLAEICRRKALDPEILLRDIEAAKKDVSRRHENYSAWDLSFLADYIVQTHHAWLNENLEPIAAYARKIAQVHGANHPEVVEIADIFDKIAADMPDHLKEEEEVFFPALKRLEAAVKMGKSPAQEDRDLLRKALEGLHREHEEIGEATHAIRRLAKDFELPADACNTFAVTYSKLKEFEDDLHKHVHLENNILFSKGERFLAERE